MRVKKQKKKRGCVLGRIIKQLFVATLLKHMVFTSIKCQEGVREDIADSYFNTLHESATKVEDIIYDSSEIWMDWPHDS